MIQTSKNNIYLICGASGTGKTTIVNKLCKQYGYKQLESYTTRPRRSKKETGHIFIKESDILTILENDKIIADVNYNGNYYFATEKQLEESDLYIIDPQGIESLKDKYKGKKNLIVIEITSPERVRIRRMVKRGDSAAEVQTRIATDRQWFSDIKSNIQIENNDLTTIDEIVDEIYKTITALDIAHSEVI